MTTSEIAAAPDADGTRKSSRLRVFRRRTSLAILGIATLLVSGLAVSAPAAADEYPTWEDVQNAKNNESLKQGEIDKITSLIAQLETNVAVTRQASVDAGNEYFAAQEAYEMQKQTATDLQTQADAEKTKEDDASAKAGAVASQLYRDGGDDTALKLFFADGGDNADDLLEQLGQMDKLIERNQTVYNDAVQAKNNAQSLSDQAATARDERDRLQKVAEEKWVAAQAAAQAAADALAASEANKITLEAQLAALKDETTSVTTKYEEGVEKRRLEEEARKAAAEAEARRLAEEAAANQNNGGGGGGDYVPPSSGGGGPSVGNGGWTRPSNGWQTSGYGPRYSQCGPSYCMSSFHRGVDLASGCGSAIYAAQSGTVDYAGYNGGYGNYIRIAHGGGVGTGYGHIKPGGILVSSGQWVNAGDLIALEGETGNSFGCHLHFEVYIYGDTVNPIDYMAARGVYV